MNEISDPRDQQAVALASRPDPSSSVLHLSILRESAETDQLYMAIAIAQASFVSPKRNRKVDVVKNGVKLYSFKYATLDAINDMMRQHLADNKLALIQPPVMAGRQMSLLTKVVHYGSGQWLEFEIPLTAPNDPQAFASLLTYYRRYATTSLLNIAADEDDDGNRAIGRQVHDQPDDQPPQPVKVRMPYIDDPHLGSVVKSLVRLCSPQPDENATDIDYMLDFWLRQLPEFEKLRGKKPDIWRFVCTQVRDAIARVLGADVALLYSQPTAAINQAEWVAVDAKLRAKLSGALEKLSSDHPETHARIMRNIEAHRARFAPVDEVRKLPEHDLEAEAQALEEIISKPAEQPVAPQPVNVPSFAHQLLDETGELASDVITNPVIFTRAYINMLDKASPVDQRMIVENNVDAVQDAWLHAEAAKLLEALPPPPPKPTAPEAVPDAADLVVTPQLSGGGTIQLAPYLAGVRDSLVLVRGPLGMDAWMLANRATLLTLPTMTQVKVMDKVNTRCAQLGIPPRALS